MNVQKIFEFQRAHDFYEFLLNDKTDEPFWKIRGLYFEGSEAGFTKNAESNGK